LGALKESQEPLLALEKEAVPCGDRTAASGGGSQPGNGMSDGPGVVGSSRIVVLSPY